MVGMVAGREGAEPVPRRRAGVQVRIGFVWLQRVAAALVLLGAFTTVAAAHGGHPDLAAVDQAVASVAPEAVAPPDKGTPAATPACDGACCVGGMCCPILSASADFGGMTPWGAGPTASGAIALIAPGPPEGPRRPPRRRI